MAVSVLNQVVGPILMKKALRGAGGNSSHYDLVVRRLEEIGIHAHVPVVPKPQPQAPS